MHRYKYKQETEARVNMVATRQGSEADSIEYHQHNGSAGSRAVCLPQIFGYHKLNAS